MQEMKSKESKMNKEEILKEISKTKEHLANMEKMLEECNERWKPNNGEEYFYIDNTGCIQNALFISSGWYHEGLYQTYNCFKTEEEAHLEAEKILIRRQLEDIARKLNKGNKIDWNNSECIKITEHTDAGRAKTVLIGNKSLSGVEVRTLFGLKSANFKCEIDGDKVKFSVIGYGHGVGMSQTGADAMAKQGASYTEIINHFYTGIEIVDI